MTDTPLNIDNPINGQIKIADEVIAIIAGTAAKEVEGVLPPLSVTKRENLAKRDASHPVKSQGRKAKRGGNTQRFVTIGTNRENVEIKVNIRIINGYSIASVSLEVQKKVKTAVETMTALFVSSVDVSVVGVQNEIKE